MSNKVSTAVVKPYHGAPTLLINGRPDPALVYTAGSRNNRTNRYFRQFGEAGIHLYSFYTAPAGVGEPYDVSPPCWVAPDEFDYAHLDARVQMILDADPDAYFFPRLYLNSPAWWDEQHPDQLATYDPGDGLPVPYYLRPDKRAASWASRLWREDMARALRSYIAHVQASSYSDRLIGYHLTSGNTEEWFYWGGNQNQWADYSEPHRQAFGEWLQAKYGTDEALRHAWRDNDVTLETVSLPLKRERVATALGVLRDPAVERRVIDLYLFLSDLVAETIDDLAHVVKDATQGNAIVGVFYGYVLQLGGEVNLDGVDSPVTSRQRQQNAGHLALRKVWDSPHIDFLTCPASYEFRQTGTGYSHFSSPIDSIKLHGKLWLDENDYQTWIAKPNSFPGAYGRPQSYEETLNQQQREFLTIICQSTGAWWFDMGEGGWYDDERLMRDFAQMKRIAEASLEWDRVSVSEVALIVDDHSLAYLQVGNELSPALLLAQLPQLGRMGAPYSVYALDDLAEAPPHKLYVFVNCFKPEEAHRRAIEALKRDGRTLLWFYAPGFLAENGTDPAAMEALTGISIAMHDEATPLWVQVEGDDPLVAERPANAAYGTEIPLRPVFFADDAQATVLARYADGRPGLVVKRFADWTSIYSAAPTMPSWLLGNIAREAGVHRYVAAGDIVYANRSLLGISVNEGGERQVYLPGLYDVYDLFGEHWVARGVREFSASFAAQSSRLFRLVPQGLSAVV